MNPPTVTIPATRLLQALWGNRDVSYLDRTDTAFIELERIYNSGDYLKAFCYIQYKDNDGNELKHPAIHTRTSWEISYSRYLKSKVESEHRRQDSFVTSEQINKVLVCLKRKFQVMPEPALREMALNLWKSNNQTLAKQMGIDDSTIIWPTEAEKIIVERVEEAKQNNQIPK